jgi:RNA polymerase-binding transcription factor DksA
VTLNGPGNGTLALEELNVKAAIRERRGAGKGRDIATRLQGIREELRAEYEQCIADLRSTTGGGDAAECTCGCAADILRHLSAEIRDVEAALERVRTGLYGLCVDCGTPISASRLRAMPTARRCMRCQVGTERKAG